MQALQRTFDHIVAQMRDMQATTKLLIGSLVIILAMTLFLVALYAGRATMAALPLDLTGDSRTQALKYLETANIPFEERSNRLYVPVDQKYTILAQLHENRVIDGQQIDFALLIEQDSPFRSRYQNQQRALVATMHVLGSMIEAMSGVQRATVVIDKPDGIPGIGRSSVKPEASVSVTMRSRELTQSSVDAIAHLVASSVAGMPPENVTVVDARAGRSWKARAEEDLASHRHLELKEAHESYVKRKIEEALASFRGAIVSVNVIPDTTVEVLQRQHYEEPKMGVSQESSRTSSARGTSGGGEPGLMANTGARVTAGGGSGYESTDERADARMITRFPTETSQRNDPKGYAKVINATIGIPQSYFLQVYRYENGDEDATPTQDELEAIVARQTQVIRQNVEPLITAGADGAQAGTVVVNMIHDFGQLASMGGAGVPGAPYAAPPSGESSWWVNSIEGLARYIGLGSLALVSLAMMFFMVRRANVREDLPSAPELVGMPPALQGADVDVVGEADEDSPIMEGIEVDDDSLRSQQMLKQINDMIAKEPGDSAHLLRRWMKSEA